eukprot:CAMPEP_0170601810 /NCGR_PEP_ID=MMETSP0224-20130122/18055_1 /TAXON_ID=285029 /ORGANISM="Togula jolla, Strain CCCM 725" /LENGTH=161 /DNA_ID=CAMNT_0010926605 /DNA_START=490 /DNA_END=976 /DNA_ORIENTATION=-
MANEQCQKIEDLVGFHSTDSTATQYNVEDAFIGQEAGAQHLLNDLQGSLGVDAEDPSVKNDCISFCTVVRAYADSGDTEGALQIVEKMLSTGLLPNECVFNIVLGSCAVSRMEAEYAARSYSSALTQQSRRMPKVASDGDTPAAVIFSMTPKQLEVDPAAE